MTISEVAQQYLAAGLSVLPAIPAEKRPTVSWKEFQSRRPTPDELAKLTAGADGLCLIAGEISGNLEMIDFDRGGELFDAWCDKVPVELLARCVIERSQSGGKHVIYRNGQVCGNMKLAQGRRDGNLVTLIETRGEGGLFLCHPTPGYEIEQGEITELPVLTSEERETLLAAAFALSENIPIPKPVKTRRNDDSRPGDEYNERGNVRWVLEKHGWTLERPGENEYWCRPGKPSGCSATLKDGVFYCFSSNASPFEAGQAYAPFSVYAMLEHAGDYSAAAADLKRQGFGDSQPSLVPMTVDDDDNEPVHSDPGPLPAKLLEVPGLLRRVMDWNLDGAFVPQQNLALAGALSLMATLTGRKVADQHGSRTNLYILAVAGTGMGKDQARRANSELLYHAGQERLLGPEGIASHAGLISAIEQQPAMLFQLDEIGRLLKTLGDGARNPHLYGIATVLMRLFTSSAGMYRGDAYADSEKNKTIDQPHACIYGTTEPKSLYEGLTPDSITDGFLSRMLIFEGSDNAPRQTPKRGDPPAEIIDAVRWWGEYQPCGGNLGGEHPEPTVVPFTEDAAAAMSDYELWAHEQLRRQAADPLVKLWTRAGEKARKLALLWTCSKGGEEMVTDLAAVEWAITLTSHLTRRMIYLAGGKVSEDRFEAKMQALVSLLRDWHREHRGDWMPYHQIARKLRWPKREHEEIRDTLIDARMIEVGRAETNGRPALLYRLGQKGKNVAVSL